jgi:tetratricopeptide (TPR) repeat protein
MNRGARLAAAAAIALVSAIAVYRLCYQRYRCNIDEAQAERRINALFAQAESPSARLAARQIAETMDHCIECSPTDVSHYMARAAALRMLSRPAEAAKEYRRALEVDRRAELFLNAGLTELEAGREPQAEDALITAMLVYYSDYDLMPAPIKFRVVVVVNPIYAEIQQHRATPATLRELFNRVARVPME